MKNFGVCFAITVIGFIITFGLYMTGGSAILNYLQKQGGGAPENYLRYAFMLIFPICLFAGSFISGYFCQPYISKSYYFLFLSQGVYSAIYILLTSGGTIPGYFEFILLCSAIWVCTSISAIFIGKYFRSKKNANLRPYSDTAKERRAL